MTRRNFLERAGLGSLAALGAGSLPASMASAMAAAVDNTEPMKIVRVDAVTFRKDIRIGGGSGGSDGAEFWWVRLHTDKGIVGTGEPYPYSNSEIGALKDFARNLIGKDPRDIDGIWRNLFFQSTMRNSAGAEIRTVSATHITQMDILGK